MNQQTISSALEFTGIGLHTGKESCIKLEPMPPDSGIVFRRADLPDAPPLKALASNVVNTQRCTVLGNGFFKISTVEHLLSSLYSIGIDNLMITVDAEEIPAMDGSSIEYFNALTACGLKTQAAPRKVLSLQQPCFSVKNGSIIIALPSQDRRFTVMLDYDHPMIGTQICDFDLLKDSYCEKIAPARTFGFLHEVQALLDRNLARGGDISNALVIMPDGFSTPLRLENEPVHHKCLDLIGDISLSGLLVFAHIIAIKSGHALNVDFALKLEQMGGFN